MKSKKIIIATVSTIVAIAILWFCFGGKSKSANYIIETAQAVRGDVSEAVTATGTIEPVTQVEVGTKAKSTFESSEANLAKAKRNLAYATITSPIDGVVISRAVEEGQTVAAGFETPTLFTIAADLTQMQVIADVDEADIGGVQEGQRVIFTVDAYPNDTFEGTVTQVRLEATEESNVVTYEVVISAHNPDLKLKPGLTANITIYTAERRNVVNIPLKALRFVPDPPSGKKRHEPEDLPQQEISGNDSLKIVWVQDGQEWKPRKVVVGMDNSVNVEICSGLEAGETVAIDRKSNINATNRQLSEEKEESPFMPKPPGKKK